MATCLVSENLETLFSPFVAPQPLRCLGLGALIVFNGCEHPLWPPLSLSAHSSSLPRSGALHGPSYQPSVLPAVCRHCRSVPVAAGRAWLLCLAFWFSFTCGAALLLLVPDTRVCGLIQPARLSFRVSCKKFEA